MIQHDKGDDATRIKGFSVVEPVSTMVQFPGSLR